MSYAQADRYRRRAHHLRTLAHQIQHTPAMTLENHATVDTWRGPCAQACNQQLASAQRAVHLAVDDLASRAWRFDRLADETEAAAIRADRQANEAEEAAERVRSAADPPARRR